MPKQSYASAKGVVGTNGSKPASKYGVNKGTAEYKGQDLGWEDVERLQDGILADVVRAVTAAGDTIQFSVARNGGAIGVRVYDGGPCQTVWSNTAGEALEVLKNIISDARLALGE